jgi:hypothetical protein
MAYTWNEGAGRFVDGRGRFVSESAVRSVIDDVADAASSRMQAASEALLDGRMSLGAWQAEMQATVKLAHSAAAVIANGGAESMTFSAWGSVGQTVRSEYGYLRQFAEQIASGEQPLNGSLTARAAQYGQASRSHFERVRGDGQRRRGYLSCRNVLHAGESCSQCKAQSARGWVATGSLVPVGQRICRGNCKCSIAYRREPADVVGEQAA